MRNRIAKLVVWTVLVAMILFSAPGYEVQCYSCHKCRNLKQISIPRFLFFHGRPEETVEERVPVPAEHQHEWWRFATHQSQGVGGKLYESAASKPFMYKDQTDHPTQDERQSPAAPDQLR
jgi:hypothetical protein